VYPKVSGLSRKQNKQQQQKTQKVMAAKLTRLTHKIATQLHLMAAVPFAVLAPGGQSENFWVHPRSVILQW
jgi:hypothetical protein